jgi:hypothetical protein
MEGGLRFVRRLLGVLAAGELGMGTEGPRRGSSLPDKKLNPIR